MKSIFTLLLYFQIILCAKSQTQNNYIQVPSIKSNSITADYRVGKDWVKGRWTISPHLSYDTLIIICHSTPESFGFYTDIDSITFNLSPGQVFSFKVQLKDNLVANTVIIGKALSIEKMSYSNKCTLDSITTIPLYEKGYLENLKSNYLLDTLIKSPSDDLQNANSIMNWVHSLWRHNGINSANNNDAISIIEEAKSGKQFRCVEYSIVLCACLNAVGIKARILSIMSSDVATSKGGAGHVVVEAYLNNLNKWALMDPQWNVIPLFQNQPQNGIELRNSIITDYEKLLIMSHSSVSKRHYLDFIFNYLYFYSVSYSELPFNKNQVKSHLMLVPKNVSPPTKFQIAYELDYFIYTNCIPDFYLK